MSLELAQDTKPHTILTLRKNRVDTLRHKHFSQNHQKILAVVNRKTQLVYNYPVVYTQKCIYFCYTSRKASSQETVSRDQPVVAKVEARVMNGQGGTGRFNTTFLIS